MLLGAVLLLLYLAFLVQTVLHEGGHLLFGLWSGYRFSSFRVLNLMWVKVDGRLRLRRLSILGTGGQCLMAPPEPVEGKIPVVAYNLGGVVVNLLAALLCLGLYLAGPRMGLGAVAALIAALIALLAFLYIKYRQSMEIGQYFYVVRGVPQQMPPDEVEAIIDQLPEESRS